MIRALDQPVVWWSVGVTVFVCGIVCWVMQAVQ